jgi:hypothetical protein
VSQSLGLTEARITLAIVVFEFAEQSLAATTRLPPKRSVSASYMPPSSSAISPPLILKRAVPITSYEELQDDSMPKNSMNNEYWVSHFDSQNHRTRSCSSREPSEPRRKIANQDEEPACTSAAPASSRHGLRAHYWIPLCVTSRADVADDPNFVQRMWAIQRFDSHDRMARGSRSRTTFTCPEPNCISMKCLSLLFLAPRIRR